jgi:glycosyltransferase involved in cell wall biosynthesis
MRPLISVVVAAYNRHKFLLNALRSIVNQRFKGYEVIVTKNFHDEVIDDFIRRYGFKEVFIDTKYYGEQLATAIEEVRGDVVSFLEDDDEFEQDKLYWIKKIFTQYKAVSFFHDARRYINERSEIISLKDPKYRSIILSLESILRIEMS